MKKKGAIVITILIMAIGFAAISTTLIINGSTSVGENIEDFDVIFTKASLDGEDVYQDVISQDKKTITFETSELKTLNQTSVLSYEVTNNSNNYDADIVVNCKVKDNVSAKYTSIENVLEGNATKISAKETLNGTLTVTLEKSAIEEVTEEYICEVTANAKERDILGYNGITEWIFDYTGSEQIFTAPTSGIYKIETWGAQGGNALTYYGGKGGYSEGDIYLSKNVKIYVNVGGKGLTDTTVDNGYLAGGYNGGGGSFVNGSLSLSGRYGLGSGGGATHIALSSGLLSSFENKISDILIVSAGGGGAMQYYNSNQYYSHGNGGSGGGFRGANTTSGYYWANGYIDVVGATQFQPTNLLATQYPGGFGQGYGSESFSGSVGGGGGFYGGNSQRSVGGSGGSGYIGNSLLTEKSMYCYNCEESSEESTKTISTTCVNETPTTNCAKLGNGYARITLIN